MPLPMIRLNETKELQELLAERLNETDDDLPQQPPGEVADAGWEPDLNPSQKKIFDDPAQFILAHGEKGTGKSVGCLHKLVRHCYENENALVWLISTSIRTGAEGALYDLENLVLPQWGHGMGLQFTQSKLDPNTKDRHLWVGNRFGGWSKVLIISVQNGHRVQDKVKGPAPSMVYVEELTNCHSRDYFTYPAAQLERRRNITGPQQFVASCNPEGPSHWVYQVWWVDCVDPDTGVRDPAFSAHHVPITENLHRLPPRYIDNLNKIIKDPIERRRLIDGEWIDRPSGSALFRSMFDKNLHVKGDYYKNVGLKPLAHHPILVGYDLGSAHSSVTFMQCIPTKEKKVWLVFDELVKVDQYIPYKELTLEILQRMTYWSDLVKFNFHFEHISDNSAFNQWRPGSGDKGSFDYLEIYKHSGERIRMRPAPKNNGSIQARVRMVMDMLCQRELLVSATCPKTVDMLQFIECKPQKRTASGLPDYDPDAPFTPKKCPMVHPFDSMTYPMFELMLGGLSYQNWERGSTTPQMYTAGRG